MRNNQLHHHVSTMSPPCLHNRNGSILIWTVLLGFLLTSVFFFFSMRQRANITVQRDTAEILNTKAYLESYADYLESLSSAKLEDIRDKAGDATFDNITGTATNEVDEIVDIADFGSLKSYTFDGDIYVEWNKCSGDSECSGASNGDLYVKNVLYKHESAVCIQGYCDIVGPISVANPEIETLNSPFKFRITAKDSSTTIEDNNWYTNIGVDLGYSNKVKINRTFKPKT